MLGIDLSNVEGGNAPTNTALPESKYHVSITAAEVKQTRAKTGQYIKVEFTVQEGEHKGRKVWTNFNIKNPNPQAVEIGFQQLKDMLVAANSSLANDKLNSVSELLGLHVIVKTKNEESEDYGTQTKVHWYEPLEPETGQVKNYADDIPGVSDDDDLPNF